MQGSESPQGGESPREDEAHDVLAAEAFALPAADPTLRHRPITLPEDPSGIAEPHDVLAAEEFAMPAPRPAPAPPGTAGRIAAKARTPMRVLVAAAVVAGVLRAFRRRRPSRS
ncbi:MAG: hypothetical protein JO262_06565 [Solirubrobacterales bacterium]|nr:hypothetical protein [Solirubrobacterales bacterium]MBV9941777.1 hypothetical protein [Solirubrobacterales bacterium]